MIVIKIETQVATEEEHFKSTSQYVKTVTTEAKSVPIKEDFPLSTENLTVRLSS